MSAFNIVTNLVGSFLGGNDNKSSGDSGAAYAKAVRESSKKTAGFVKKAMTLAAENRSGVQTNLTPKQLEQSKYAQELLAMYREADTPSLRNAIIQQLRNNGNHRIALNLQSDIEEA